MQYQDPDYKSSDRQRKQMIEKQLKARGIWDERVLQAFDKVKRHEFVSEALYRMAYSDHPLPISGSQTISQPYIVAYMTQELLLQGHERVLEIGTGSGYQTAILAELCSQVVSVERIEELYKQSWERLLVRLKYANIRMIFGNGLDELDVNDSFERILITAASPAPPLSLMRLLSPGGLMIVPIGDRYSQVLYRIMAHADNFHPDGQAWSDFPGYYFRRLLDVRFVPLIGPGGWKE